MTVSTTNTSSWSCDLVLRWHAVGARWPTPPPSHPHPPPPPPPGARGAPPPPLLGRRSRPRHAAPWPPLPRTRCSSPSSLPPRVRRSCPALARRLARAPPRPRQRAPPGARRVTRTPARACAWPVGLVTAAVAVRCVCLGWLLSRLPYHPPAAAGVVVCRPAHFRLLASPPDTRRRRPRPCHPGFVAC